jgi:hypothetical protein
MSAPRTPDRVVAFVQATRGEAHVSTSLGQATTSVHGVPFSRGAEARRLLAEGVLTGETRIRVAALLDDWNVEVTLSYERTHVAAAMAAAAFAQDAALRSTGQSTTATPLHGTSLGDAADRDRISVVIELAATASRMLLDDGRLGDPFCLSPAEETLSGLLADRLPDGPFEDGLRTEFNLAARAVALEPDLLETARALEGLTAPPVTTLARRTVRTASGEPGPAAWQR